MIGGCPVFVLHGVDRDRHMMSGLQSKSVYPCRRGDLDSRNICHHVGGRGRHTLCLYFEDRSRKAEVVRRSAASAPPRTHGGTLLQPCLHRTALTDSLRGHMDPMVHTAYHCSR